MGFLSSTVLSRFEEKKRDVLPGGTVMMISGCEDAQTSADVSNVADFELPDPAGRAGGACTSTLLNVLYEDHSDTGKDLSFVQVLIKMRTILESRGYTQVPQLTSSRQIDVNSMFDLVPDETSGTRRALLIGINYIGHSAGVLSGCHNDVGNMVEYIKDVHGFPEENITLLLDDGEHTSPTYENIMAAYRKIIEESEPGDAIFCHYSGHGAKIKDDDLNEEEDGYDESLVPLDYKTAGVIRDDDIYATLVKPLKEGVTLTCLMDCCHSGTVLDLPYHFKPGQEGDVAEMQIDESYNFGKLFSKIGATVGDLFDP
uniref:Peptidase C14 caspase domain-containing protein n=1 Tax=Grammatophora oceanica TaxID=210454 RepID=A0A7S1Y5I7_9STRA|mmetsp:Transcript_23382/g.34659  ORF Transcript_23382/g.34659 Transcript_23382/m.34659 type:complete len:314 (+) Transcript_23382:98-1039(+)|eukprot:CAMPEP_0194041198 /NCGR_PEP_ID=MMETSP0009_2-20130614/13088_1 /TAXON_ID=210454 /ORGANISM="Grammatophora oceanica, Strain CCMP 410" /LENGTH=313 /DNA_ID=CAMNT_0038684587 /DNA_START=109 /DNA_END=1050 /DNA_ORIENTATION=+